MLRSYAQRPWDSTTRQGLGPPPPQHRPPPARPTSEASREPLVPVDQQMRLSLAERMQPELYQQRATSVGLRAQNLKLARQNRRLQLEVSRLESVAATAVSEASLESWRRGLIAEYEKERDLHAREYQHQISHLRGALAGQIERANQLQQQLRMTRMPLSHIREAGEEEEEARAGVERGSEPPPDDLMQKLAAGQLLTSGELEALRMGAPQTGGVGVAEAAEVDVESAQQSRMLSEIQARAQQSQLLSEKLNQALQAKVLALTQTVGELENRLAAKVDESELMQLREALARSEERCAQLAAEAATSKAGYEAAQLA